MKKIYVSEDACIGCGACVAIDPEHFDFSDAGFSQPISQENLESEELKNAISSCPTSAISLRESDDASDVATEGCCENCDDDCEEDTEDCGGNCEHCNCKED